MATFGELPLNSTFRFCDPQDAPLPTVDHWHKASYFLAMPLNDNPDPPYFHIWPAIRVEIVSTPVAQTPLF